MKKFIGHGGRYLLSVELVSDLHMAGAASSGQANLPHLARTTSTCLHHNHTYVVFPTKSLPKSVLDANFECTLPIIMR
jgi:hypothetical protein